MHSQPETGVLTFLFTDIEDSTIRWERSPEAMAGALAAHDRIIGDVLERHGGAIFKRIGDAFCCAFRSPLDAVHAALDVQREIASQPWERALGEMRVRVGIHSGTAVARDGDYFGPSLNRAARLTATAHGGQVVLSSAAAALVRDRLSAGVQLRPLGTHRLRDLTHPETIFQLTAPQLASEFPPLRTLDAWANNLPAQLGPFSGREIELRELRDLLTSHRLVTICGPGGIGKTRLALQAAAEVLDVYEHGVWFVDLAPINDPALIPAAIARALSISEAAGEPLDVTLQRELGDRHLLLVVDNAEHMLREAAAAIKMLLDKAPQLRVVTTTRESLHVRGEHIYRLGPLESSDAERLFVERAEAVTRNAHEALNDAEDLRAVMAALEGIPLAIELAAARLATLSLSQMRERLAARLAFLHSQFSDDDRHRTLRETIAWSYELLGGAERAFLTKAAAFTGGFTLEAAEAVEPAALDLVEALADKSFLIVSARDKENRFAMLETIRDYVCEQSDSQAIELGKLQHLAYFSSLAKKGESALPRGDMAAWVRTLDADADNVRCALQFAFESDPAKAGGMLVGLFRFWYIRRRVSEGRAWLMRYVMLNRQNDEAFAAVVRRASAFASIAGEYEEAANLAKHALVRYHALHDEGGILEALHALAVNENRRGNDPGAERLYCDIAERCAKRGLPRAIVSSNANCAAVKLQRGDLDGAQALLAASEDAAQRLEDEDVHATLMALRATLAYKRADWTAAEKMFRDGLAIKREVHNQFGSAEILSALAATCVKLDREDEAQVCAAESVRIAIELDSPSLAVCALESAAGVALASGNQECAIDAFALAIALRRRHSIAERIALDRDAVEARMRSQEDLFENALNQKAAASDWKNAAAAVADRLESRTEAGVIS